MQKMLQLVGYLLLGLMIVQMVGQEQVQYACNNTSCGHGVPTFVKCAWISCFGF
jgi:hypothetical protein